MSLEKMDTERPASSKRVVLAARRLSFARRAGVGNAIAQPNANGPALDAVEGKLRSAMRLRPKALSGTANGSAVIASANVLQDRAQKV